jgi:pyridoxamine 5'-phosphate oxidase
MDPLFEPIPDFDQPIAILKHCHDRIRKQIRTMQKLLDHLPSNGADDSARRGAKAILQYFDKAAPNHHADEEEDLFPMLQATAKEDDAALLASLLPLILHEHQKMDIAWRQLENQLRPIASGSLSLLSAQDVQSFAELYAAHMEKEETQIAPMATRIFSAEQMARLGNEMAVRRGLQPGK